MFLQPGARIRPLIRTDTGLPPLVTSWYPRAQVSPPAKASRAFMLVNADKNQRLARSLECGVDSLLNLAWSEHASPSWSRLVFEKVAQIPQFPAGKVFDAPSLGLVDIFSVCLRFSQPEWHRL